MRSEPCSGISVPCIHGSRCEHNVLWTGVERGGQPDAWSLASGLASYSMRGGEYVADIWEILPHNYLARAPRNMRLAGSSSARPVQ